MRIGLISDSHDRMDHVQRAADYLRATGIDVVLHAGDVTYPHVLELLAGFDVWIAQGNMDHVAELSAAVTRLFGAERFASMHDLEFDGHQIALVHGHDRTLLNALIYSKSYEYVVRGHTHVPQDQCIKETRVLNPGAVGNAGWRRCSFAVLDLDTGELESVSLY